MFRQPNNSCVIRLPDMPPSRIFGELEKQSGSSWEAVAVLGPGRSILESNPAWLLRFVECPRGRVEGWTGEVGLHGDGSVVETGERGKGPGKVKHSGFGLEPSKSQGIHWAETLPIQRASEL